MTAEEQIVAQAAIDAESNLDPASLEGDIASAAGLSPTVTKDILTRLLDEGYLKVMGGGAVAIAETGYPGTVAEMWYEKDRNWS